MKKTLRYLIALVFIASGFVKAVDVKGFSFKLEEYFSPDVFNIPFLANYALALSVFVVAFELVLGLMLLLNIQLKTTLKLLIGLCIFFAFLTFYSAYFNKVTDCGCFGDAIKFTPWQSFWKDIALLIGLLILWFLNKKNKTVKPERNFSKTLLFTLGVMLSAFIIYKGIAHEPLIDFRDYKIGTDLNLERQKIDDNPSEYKTSYTLKNTKTGEEKIVGQDEYVNQKEYWQEGTPWQIQTGKEVSVLTKQGYQSKIDHFKLEDENGNDITEQILHLPRVNLVFSYKPHEVSVDEFEKFEKIFQSSQNAFGVTTEKGVFKTIPNLTMDGTAIKTIARSNPFVLVLENGKIIEKKSLKDFLEE